jgi:hypothetical protein
VVEALLRSIGEWARGRNWPLRVPFVVGFVYLGVRLLCDSSHATIFGGIDLGIHEAGHVVFRFGGDVICAFGGSLLQCLAPLLCAVALARLPDWFGVSFCGVWLAVNLYEVARYVADARAMALQLVTIGGGDARHDWNFLLGEFGLLRSDALLAGMLRLFAFLVMWGSIAASAWLLVKIARSRAEEVLPSEDPAPQARATRPAEGFHVVGSVQRSRMKR